VERIQRQVAKDYISVLNFPPTHYTLSKVRIESRVQYRHLGNYGLWDFDSRRTLNYSVEHAYPGFTFDITTSFAILFHNGVELGKRDFLGQLNMK
jgi:hypothetical protein